MGLLEKAFTWPPDQSWSISGPSSGGGQTIYLSKGRLFDHRYGDEAACAEGESVTELPLAEFVASGRYPHIVAELVKRGLVGV